MFVFYICTPLTKATGKIKEKKCWTVAWGLLGCQQNTVRIIPDNGDEYEGVVLESQRFTSYACYVLFLQFLMFINILHVCGFIQDENISICIGVYLLKVHLLYSYSMNLNKLSLLVAISS